MDSALSDSSTNPVQNKVITGELTDVKTAIDALKITDTASGAIASFPDGAAMPMESLTVEMSPIQDLHGQDAPYPAGGGKNKLQVTAESQTVNGVTFTVHDDGTVIANGTATADIRLVVGTLIADGATLSANGCPSGGSTSTYRMFYTYLGGDTGNGVSGMPASGSKIDAQIYVYNGYTVNNLVFKPMIRLASETDQTFAPYSNICPITGRDSVTVVRTGVNVWNEEWELGTFNANGEPVTSNNNVRTKNFISVKPSTAYYFRVPSVGITAFYYDADKTCIGVFAVSSSQVKTTDANAMFMRFRTGALTTYNHDISINYPSTDHDYHPGNVQSVTVQLGTTVYGGTVDFTTGTMTVTDAMVDATALNWSKSASQSNPNGTYFSAIASVPFLGWGNGGINTAISNALAKASLTGMDSTENANTFWWNTDRTGYRCVWGAPSGGSTLAEFTEFLQQNSVVFVGKLATPLTVQLTPEQMSTLKGTNNVWSDADSVTVEYVADPKLYIARLTEPDADMVADANITSGSYFMVGNNLYLATANIASGAAIVPGVNCTKTNLASALNAINA